MNDLAFQFRSRLQSNSPETDDVKDVTVAVCAEVEIKIHHQAFRRKMHHKTNTKTEIISSDIQKSFVVSAVVKCSALLNPPLKCVVNLVTRGNDALRQRYADNFCLTKAITNFVNIM